MYNTQGNTAPSDIFFFPSGFCRQRGECKKKKRRASHLSVERSRKRSFPQSHYLVQISLSPPPLLIWKKLGRKIIPRYVLSYCKCLAFNMVYRYTKKGYSYILYAYRCLSFFCWILDKKNISTRVSNFDGAPTPPKKGLVRNRFLTPDQPRFREKTKKIRHSALVKKNEEMLPTIPNATQVDGS